MDKKEYYKNMVFETETNLKETDPEFADFFGNFAFDEVYNQSDLDDKTKFIAILATLHGCQGIDTYRLILPIALKNGVTPVEVKEITYQATAYLGIGRTMPFVYANNTIFKEENIPLPIEGQSTTTPETRLLAGNQAQVDLFGPQMKGSYENGPKESVHINKWLADNCFGDYYTRKGLNYNQREMVTFCYILAQGGCEPQLIAHCKANMRIGNDKDFLIKVLSQCMPYIGYPRTLNALRCINEAAE